LYINAGLRNSFFTTKTKTYFRPEPRFSVAFKLAKDFALKASYADMNQYVHLLSNTGLGLPTDLWVPTTDKIAPQKSRQIALGLSKDMEQPGLTFTLEGYYKRLDNIISYKEGSSFIDLDGQNANEINWENNVTKGRGWSYGSEMLLQKKQGRLSGWIGYTLSWSQWKFPQLNSGKTFFPRYDRRHDISVVGIYELKKGITLSATWVYGTGNALTLPQANFSVFRDEFLGTNPKGTAATDYGTKNEFRAEAFHRLDIAIQFQKKKKRYERTWELGLYNAYNRKNPFFYGLDYTEDKARPGKYRNVLTRYSLFPILPSVSYHFKF
jgi:hypothetical protein